MITAVHWDLLGEHRLVAIETGFALLVIWPAPVQHDACLAKAGFDCFADDAGDDANPLALRITRCLSTLGEPRVRGGASGATPEPVAWWDRLRGKTAVLRTAAECLADAADNDNFAPCVVDVVDDEGVTAATVVSSDGHPLFWIGLRAGGGLSSHDLVTCVAAGLPVHRTALRWDVLMPASPQR